jgi:pilus assembly protein FimV
VLKLPTAEQANALPPKMARRAVMAQAHNFNAYRHNAAQNVRGIRMASAGRRASGGVQAQVQESRASAPSPDRLTLSRGGSQAAGAETAAAQSRQARDQASRVAELQRNINEINAVASQSASGPAAAASAPGISVPIGAIPGASAAASSAVAAASPASAPVKKSPLKPRPAPPPPPPPPPEPGFLDWLMDNLSLIGGGLLIALLAGGLFYLRRRKKKPASLDSSLNNSNSLSPDSAFFNASGGQRVNTQEANGPGSTSLAYSPSQLDAAGDVDPVAEADVYLAYGRDAQAEEILKEALRAHPERIAIHRKLAEIYAKRREARALQVIAAQAQGATHGQGEDWQAIAALGSQLEPDNPLYKPGATPAPAATPAAPARGNRTPYFGADTEPQTALLDPRRDSLGTPTQPSSGVDLDLDLGLPPVLQTPAAPAAPAPRPAPADLDPGLDFTPPPTPVPQPRRPAAPAPANSASSPSDMMEFDMDALSISPDSHSGAELKAEHRPDAAAGDPLDNKLALAHEFNAVGDRDGARALIKEVIAEASGSLKTRAERFLAELD